MHTGLIAVCLCVTRAVASQDRRAETLGSIDLRNDDPAREEWIGAKVVPDSHPFPLDARVGETARAKCSPDERVRIHATLLLGDCDSAPARHDAPDRDGSPPAPIMCLGRSLAPPGERGSDLRTVAVGDDQRAHSARRIAPSTQPSRAPLTSTR